MTTSHFFQREWRMSSMLLLIVWYMPLTVDDFFVSNCISWGKSGLSSWAWGLRDSGDEDEEELDSSAEDIEETFNTGCTSKVPAKIVDLLSASILCIDVLSHWRDISYRFNISTNREQRWKKVDERAALLWWTPPSRSIRSRCDKESRPDSSFGSKCVSLNCIWSCSKLLFPCVFIDSSWYESSIAPATALLASNERIVRIQLENLAPIAFDWDCSFSLSTFNWKKQDIHDCKRVSNSNRYSSNVVVVVEWLLFELSIRANKSASDSSRRQSRASGRQSRRSFMLPRQVAWLRISSLSTISFILLASFTSFLYLWGEMMFALTSFHHWASWSQIEETWSIVSSKYCSLSLRSAIRNTSRPAETTLWRPLLWI